MHLKVLLNCRTIDLLIMYSKYYDYNNMIRAENSNNTQGQADKEDRLL